MVICEKRNKKNHKEKDKSVKMPIVVVFMLFQKQPSLVCTVHI